MKAATSPQADRVEKFVSSIDGYEPKRVTEHEDAFRVFARFISRSIDGRYLERHPPAELLPDIEQLMEATFTRPADTITVSLKLSDDASQQRGVLITCMPDQRFIYSIVRLALDSLQLRSYRAINSLIPIVRDNHGDMASVGAPDAPKESFIWTEVEGTDLKARAPQIEAYLQGRLQALAVVIEDFAPLTQMVQALAEDFAKQAELRAESAAAYTDNARLLRWLLNEHFVFLGARYLPQGSARPHHVVGDFGVGKFADWRGIQTEGGPQELAQIEAPQLGLRIRKSRNEAWIYRAGRTDQVCAQVFTEDGTPAGVVIIEGLFSYPALAEPRTSVPMLDRVIEALYVQLKAAKGSHRYRAMRNAFNSLPLEYLFALPTEDVHDIVQQVLEVDVEHRPQVHITGDAQQTIVFIFVALPRSHYSDELRLDLRRLLKDRYKASSVDDGVYAGNFESVTFHYFLTGASLMGASEEQALRAEIDQLASPWSERLQDGLIERHGAKRGRALHNAYNEAFPNRYREETSIARAIEDIDLLETVGGPKKFACDVYQEKDDARLEVTRLRMFQSESLLLSDILPILDNFGLVVIDQFPTAVHVPSGGDLLINTFRVSGVQEMKCDLLTRRTRLRNAIQAVVLGTMSNDPLNRLLLRADIPWPSVVLILAYNSYARQTGLPYSPATVQEALLRNADVVRGLTELFHAKFDPAIEGQSETEVDERRLQLVERARRAVLLQLEAVDDLTSDQVLRTLFNLIESTVRTNFYARDPNVDCHVALKFDPHAIVRMPEPRPFREIFVFHPRIAGLHLRGGPVARGGIRWSDRLIDFRTEVLGLMATQNLKNVLIVPRGAKGAFVLRNPPSDMAQRRQHADEMYKIFIRGLLDVTDNLVGGKHVTPKGVLRYDELDHYLVVAADKGTAHLSDTANLLAQERDFWLADGFASGGSKGYDHKKEAITSRGAWACVRRHFREIGMDPERDAIRVVGVGDMSGDVFGNGMLRSTSMQLVAAFDHRHIFIDPSPDPARSYAARRRLFETPRSSWEDYPKEAMSPGGGIFPRGAKSIHLSPEACEALGLTVAQMSAPDLVQAILRAPVDLLWNGGIGTYIKAQTETHLEVGDPANDGVRIDATEVRARIIGEGGNLGITSAGRVELAGRGVRLNTDAVDNSAGVDMSDHEVNLKVLFQRVRERAGLDPVERDRLMDSVKEEVGQRVVHNNWVQSRMLSLDELRSRRDPARFQRAIGFLADRTPFRRRDAHLPGERLARMRGQKSEGMFRPELAFLAANAKLDMRQELGRATAAFPLDSLKEYLFSYFPAALTERFAEDIRHHPLAINIARTVLVNRLVGDVGASWLSEMSIMTGRSTADILHAYFGASALIDARTLKQQVDALEPRLDANVEYRLRLRIDDALEEVSMWLLRRKAPAGDAFYKAFPAAMLTLPAVAGAVDDLQTLLQPLQPPADLERAIAVLPRIDAVLDIALLASQSEEPVARASAAFFLVSSRSGIGHLLQHAAEGQSTDDLDRPARLALHGQLRHHMLQLAHGLMRTEPDLTALGEASSAWLDGLARELEPLDTGAPPVCNLVVAIERIARRSYALFGTTLQAPPAQP
jgi:glutamate dehydrogenase